MNKITTALLGIGILAAAETKSQEPHHVETPDTPTVQIVSDSIENIIQPSTFPMLNPEQQHAAFLIIEKCRRRRKGKYLDNGWHAAFDKKHVLKLSRVTAENFEAGVAHLKKVREYIEIMNTESCVQVVHISASFQLLEKADPLAPEMLPHPRNLNQEEKENMLNQALGLDNEE